MNYINRPKECYTQGEWIEYLEESIRELRKDKENLKKEKGEIRQRLIALEKNLETLSRVKENKELREENKNLKKKIQTLELWLDNKEKLNEELRKQIDKYKHYYDRDKEELMESCYSLAKENDKLKSDLSECECSFLFENDEVWFWKREYKRLKKWIKDHCNWYWNLFPEDEMKRQRKKADKKRKKEEIRVARDEHSYDEIWGE